MLMQDTPEVAPDEDTQPTEPEQTDDTLLAEAPSETEEGDEATPTEGQPKYTVKLDGHEVEVELEELLKGYQRQADYTAKTTAVATRERELAERAKQAEALRQQESNRLQTALQAAQASLAYDVQQIDWDGLLQNNPQEYLVKQRQVQQRQAQIQTAMMEQQRLHQEENQKREAELRTTIEREQAALATVVPEWKDDSKRAAEVAEMRRWAISQGYPEDQLNSVNLARDVLTLRKAMLYDKMISKVPQAKAATSAPPPPTPVSTKAKASVDPDKMDMQTWMKWRTAQIQKQRAS